MMMRVNRTTLVLGIMGLVLGMADGSRAHAESLTVQTLFNVSDAKVVDISYKSSPLATGYQDLKVYAGGITTSFEVPGTDRLLTQSSYCVDLLHHLTTEPVQAVVTQVSGIVTGASSFDVFDRNVGAAGWLLRHIDPTNAQQNAALQVAIWEATYDADGTQTGAQGLSSGAFKLRTTGAIFNLAASYLDLARVVTTNTYRTSSIGFVNFLQPTNGHLNQDQIIRAVPEPASLGLAGLGILGIGIYGRRRRNRQNRAAT